MFVAMVTRTLKPGITFEQYRRAWYHTVGFGVPTTMYTVVHVDDPRKITSIGLVDVDTFQLMKEFEIDVKERKEHPLHSVVESSMVRNFGLVVAIDDFSAEGDLRYKPAEVHGKLTDFDSVPAIMARILSDLEKANRARAASVGLTNEASNIPPPAATGIRP